MCRSIYIGMFLVLFSVCVLCFCFLLRTFRKFVVQFHFSANSFQFLFLLSQNFFTWRNFLSQSYRKFLIWKKYLEQFSKSVEQFSKVGTGFEKCCNSFEKCWPGFIKFSTVLQKWTKTWTPGGKTVKNLIKTQKKSF